MAQDYDAGLESYYNRDYAAALREWRPLAEQGHADAQVSLGLMYAGGHGVAQNSAEAVRWYRKAAEQGNAAAQRFLGGMFDIGQGVPQDYVQAHMWLNLSANQGNENATSNRDIVEGKMTQAQFDEAQKLAREWKPK